MAGYFDEREPDATPIQHEEALLPDYIPDEVTHRENELQMVADSIKPLIHKRTPENMYIFGKPGIGKTMCLRFLLRELMTHSSAVLPVYVNCWENQTLSAVYNRIIEAMRLPLPRRGLAPDEVFDRILQYVKNYDRRILLVLDDADGLRQNEVLQALAKANEHGVMFGVITIANDKEPLANFEPRIRSSMHFVEMEFKPYTEEQLFSIVRRRAEAALVPSSFDERVLTKIARSAIDDGSARLAIERLWRASKRAEKAGRAKVMLQDVEDCIGEESTFKRQELGLNDEEKEILSIFEQSEKNERKLEQSEKNEDGPNWLESSELYKKIEESGKVEKSKRQIRNYLESLESKGLIESEDVENAQENQMKSKMFRIKKRD